MSEKELIIASNNRGKIREYADILRPLGFRVFSQQEKGIRLDPEETGSTFEENALLKARAVFDTAHCCVIADDSGLEVEALNGEPGLYSARYKGLQTEHERRMAILDGLKGAENRKARFVCCICLMEEDGQHRLFKGVWNGTIAFQEEGENGFGYDPIFISEDGQGKTTASMPISFKETYSHRAKATALLTEYLKEKELICEEISTEHIVQDEWIDFRRSAYRFPDGRVFKPYYSYTRRDYAVTVATDEAGRVLCVRQFRQGIRAVTTEFPAGGIDSRDLKESGIPPEETALRAAKRELLEETGYESDEWTHLMTVPAQATISDNYAYLFAAKNCRRATGQSLDAMELLKCLAVTPEELEGMISRGGFQQAVHILAWLLYCRKK